MVTKMQAAFKSGALRNLTRRDSPFFLVMPSSIASPACVAMPPHL